MATVDPYTLTYNAIAECIKESRAMQLAVPRLEYNFVNYNDKNTPRKTELRDSDIPELQLLSAFVSGNLNVASNAVEIKRDYRVLVIAGPGILSKYLYPIEWALTCLLVDSNFKQKLFDLEWAGFKFVRGVSLVQTAQGESDPTVNKMIQGWAADWSIRLHFILPQRQMINFNIGQPLDTPAGI